MSRPHKMVFINTPIFIFSILLVLVIWGCSDNAVKPEPADTEAVTTPIDAMVLFVDKSLSLEDDEALKDLEKPLLEHAKSKMDEQGDHFFGFFIHGNTLSGKTFAAHELTWEIPNLEGLGGTSRKKELNKVEDKRRAEQGIVLKNISEALNAKSQTETNRETDIWATLEAASRSFAMMPADSRKEIIYVSDLEESVKGEGRRDFTKRAPASKAEAEEWAAVDATWINTNLGVDADQLAGTRVTVYLPRNAHTSSDFQQVRYYWEALFANWGMELVEVN